MTAFNDWPIKKCLIFSISVLLLTITLTGLAALGLDIPILSQIIGFIFLTFVPGILILRILRIHNIGTIESLVYAVGLSLASVMFSGALINFILPLVGISKPISPTPVTIALAVLTLILMAAAYMRDKAFTGPKETTPWKKLRLPPVLSLILLLLLTILSVALIDAYQNNILLLICLIAIAGVVGLAAFGKFIQPGIYPLAIFIISLCLLYQTTLMSPYLIGSDIYTEYHFYQLVASSGSWDAAIPSTVNSCLSIIMLAPVYSLFLNIDGILVFKAVYPLLFSLVPLILFHVFSQQMSPKKAFLAAFFFIAVPTFSLEMISLCRQQIAELFLALVILLLVDRKLSIGPKVILAAIFAPSIVVSHYALGFIGFIYMGLFLPLVFVIRSSIFRKAWGWLTRKAGGLPQSLTGRQPGALPIKALVIVAVIFFIFGFTWYGTIASGKNLDVLSSLWTRQTGIITTELSKLVPKSTQPNEHPAFFNFSQRDVLIQTALGLDFPQASPQGKGFRILQYITQLFLIIGCLRLVFKPRLLGFTAEYIALSLTSAMLILACIFLPYFANLLNTTRMYHIALITLAPFCILGGEGIWLGVSHLWQKIRRGNVVRGFSLASGGDNQAFLSFMALGILIPYFLFTSGFIYEVTNSKVTDRIDAPYSFALSSYRLDLTGVFYWRDGAAAEWLNQKVDKKTDVFSDQHASKLLRLYGIHEFPGNAAMIPRDASKLPVNSYIYLTTWNINEGEITFEINPGLSEHISFDDIPGLIDIIEGKDRVYNNGGAQVLRLD